MRTAAHTSGAVCFNCGYEVGVGPQRRAVRCPECGVHGPIRARCTAPWPPVYRLALSLTWVGLGAGGVVVVIALLGRLCARLHLTATVDAANAIGGLAFGIGLLLAFVYAVSKPDDLLTRHAPRQGSGWAYAQLLGLSLAANVGVLLAVLVVLAGIQRVL